MHNNDSGKREIVRGLEQEFAGLLAGLTEFIRSVPADLVYKQPRNASVTTIGENVLRSAALVEQLFGGLTANLWDDPFEWTLPETLSTPDLILEYLVEVDAARQRAFSCFVDDVDLLKYVTVPSGEPRYLLSLLLETLVRASNYRGRAIATVKILGDIGAAGFII